MEGLRTLSREMQEASGVNNPLGDWFDKMFGKWKALFISISTTVAIFLSILVTFGCCCVPCIRSLCNRCITKTFEAEGTSVQMVRMLSHHSTIPPLDNMVDPSV